MLKHFLASIILFLSASYFAQTGKTIFLDSITKLPISFVKVSIPNKDVFVLSNSKGEIQLDTLWNQTDKLLVFCYGYKPQYITAKTEKSVFLSPLYKQLKPITITAKKHRYGRTKLGETDHPSKRELNDIFGELNVLTGKNGEIATTWIPNDKSLNGYLEQVNIYLLAMGVPTSYFRLHFYECSKLKLEPGQEITSQNIIAKGTKGNEWVSVNLKQLKIPISENGIFIGVEWFDSELKDTYSDTIIYSSNHYYIDNVRQKNYQEKRVFKGNGIVVGQVYDYYSVNKHKNWRIKDGKWVDTTLHNEKWINSEIQTQITPYNLVIPVPCINVDIRYVKQKNTSEFDDAKKRKLNRIEKVKEDNFMYPQSTVEELISSIVKAGEKNELIYLFKYLFVYQENEFSDFLSFAKESNGKLTQEEQNNFVRYVKNILHNLTENSIVHIEGNDYELHINDEIISLTHEKGKWKINPYTRYKLQNAPMIDMSLPK